jgi:hypothetical protein
VPTQTGIKWESRSTVNIIRKSYHQEKSRKTGLKNTAIIGSWPRNLTRRVRINKQETQMGKCLKWNFSTQNLMGQTWTNRRNFIQEIWKQWWTEYNKTNDCPTKQETGYTVLFPWHSISRTPRSRQNSGKA